MRSDLEYLGIACCRGISFSLYVAGNADGSGTAGFYHPAEVTLLDSNLYGSDYGNNTIREIEV